MKRQDFYTISLIIILPLAAFTFGIRWLNEKSDRDHEKYLQHEQMVRDSEKSQRAHEEKEHQKQVKFLNAVANGEVLEGMSTSQVIDALGLPDRRQFRLSDDKQFQMETWTYNRKRKIVSFLCSVNSDNLYVFSVSE